MQPSRRGVFFVTLCAIALEVVSGLEPPLRFLLISSPSSGNVYYAKLPSVKRLTSKSKLGAYKAKVLIDGEFSVCKGSGCTENSDQGLKKPVGLALYQRLKSATLYIADADAQSIYAYEIAGGGEDFKEPWPEWLGGPPRPWGPGDDLMVGRQRRVVQGVEGLQGLAVDADGSLFYTVSGGQVMRISASDIASGNLEGSVALYTSEESDQVSTPVAVAVDGYHLFWANQAGGQVPGTIVTASESVNPTKPAAAPTALASNGVGAYGVCLGRGNVFFSAETAALFAVKTTGGVIAQVNGEFGAPRGCVFDDESTLYVADETSNGVYSLPAVSSLRAVRKLTMVANVTGPNQIAIFTGLDDYLKGPTQDCYSAAMRLRDNISGLLLLVVATLTLRN